jgi:mannitol/fructose-specific phosphotransferase system IIA component (Ntr-type)/CBS domain-containing protein
MQLISLLDAKLIYFEENKQTKDEILTSMVGKICSFYKLPSCDDRLLEKVLAREKESSTVYPTGLAIPHIRMEGFNDTVICMCVPRHPIRYEDIDIRLFMLIITDKSSAKLYLNLVAAVMKLSKDKEFMEKIYQEKDGNGIYNLLKNTDIRVKQELIIQDIMTPDPFVIKETATLRELGDLLGKHNVTFVPVVDEQGKLVGEVNVLQFLKVGVPDYLMMMDNLNFLRSFEPFERLFEKEEMVKVKEIMSPAEEFTYPTSSIIKVVFEMIQHQKRVYTVIDKNKVVGIVTAMDIFRKVVRA